MTAKAALRVKIKILARSPLVVSSIFTEEPIYLGPDKLIKAWNILHLVIKVSKVGDHSRRGPEGSLFNSYYIEV